MEIFLAGQERAKKKKKKPQPDLLAITCRQEAIQFTKKNPGKAWTLEVPNKTEGDCENGIKVFIKKKSLILHKLHYQPAEGVRHLLYFWRGLTLHSGHGHCRGRQ